MLHVFLISLFYRDHLRIRTITELKVIVLQPDGLFKGFSLRNVWQFYAKETDTYIYLYICKKHE